MATALRRPPRATRSSRTFGAGDGSLVLVVESTGPSTGFLLTLVGLGAGALALYATRSVAQSRLEASTRENVGKFDAKTAAALVDLHPLFRSRLLAFLSDAQAANIPVYVESGVRSWRRQYQLRYAATHGNNGSRPAALPGTSAHEYGLAADVGVTGETSKSRPETFAKLGEIAVRHGLVWGGAFKGEQRDPVHFELSGWRKLRDAKAVALIDVDSPLDPAPVVPAKYADALAQARSWPVPWSAQNSAGRGGSFTSMRSRSSSSSRSSFSSLSRSPAASFSAAPLNLSTSPALSFGSAAAPSLGSSMSPGFGGGLSLGFGEGSARSIASLTGAPSLTSATTAMLAAQAASFSSESGTAKTLAGQFGSSATSTTGTGSTAQFSGRFGADSTAVAATNVAASNATTAVQGFGGGGGGGGGDGGDGDGGASGMAELKAQVAEEAGAPAESLVVLDGDDAGEQSSAGAGARPVDDAQPIFAYPEDSDPEQLAARTGEVACELSAYFDGTPFLIGLRSIGRLPVVQLDVTLDTPIPGGMFWHRGVLVRVTKIHGDAVT